MPVSRPMTSKDAFALLGLTGPVGGEALKTAFRAAAKAARPDHAGGDEDRFRQVIEAYRLLQTLEKARSSLPPPRNEPPQSAQPATLEITPAEALNGVARPIRLPNGRRLGLRLPAGLRAGEVVRLAGQGDKGADLILTVTIPAADGLRVIGDDLWMEWAVEPTLLSHGGRLRVTGPAGEHAVTVPPALPEPHRLRLKDKGLPARAGRAQGHIFLTLKPAAKAASDRTAERLGQFKRAWMRG